MDALDEVEDARAFDEAMVGQAARLPGAAALHGRPGLWVRVDDCQSIYTVQDDVLLAAVVTLGHRKDVYRR